MRALIVEDDPASRELLLQVLSPYGHCDTAVNGREAVESFRRSLDESTPYDLICMDIMMPEVGGQQALRRIREIEKQAGIPDADEVKVIMTTALNETGEVSQALFNGGACAYFVKPLQIDNLIRELVRLRLIAEQ
jgi:two-component system chemotaxis response regulator CheY